MHKERLSPWKAAAGAAVFLLAEACGGTTPATPNPTRTPDIVPTNTPALVTPTPEATRTLAPTPSASPDVTPTPTPTVEVTPPPTEKPLILSDIIDELIQEAEKDGYTNVSAQEVSNKLAVVLEDPNIANAPAPSPFTEKLSYYIEQSWNMLKTGSPEDKEAGALSLISNLFQALKIDNNENIYKDPASNGAIELVIDYMYNHLNQQSFDYVITEARDTQ
ncbi:MAG: hypothetical protein A3B38_00560 [Candidatus Levybacteria bacterium RIFCSPLOWO2_01_FULL_36_13]|nr:MAG: hypothetical protein A2684_01800 [Candidatus Levybacteria bacterium RIFCSPHIGHO2_01_FULL_36_15b]OGH35379.1 MAG: hypothetical protein A3B38_00560 [Candidatus Levybacteria bacterium RIFCSPLOWO2_01_FULL_36_13]